MSTPEVLAAPLHVSDPPKVGDFWLDARLSAGPAGIAYLGHGDDQTPVMLIMLAEGAAEDAGARDRLAGEVNQMHVDTVIARGGHGQSEGRLSRRYRSEDDDPVGSEHSPLSPWVALAWDGTQEAVAEADRILDAVDLSSTRHLGSPAGPDYALHWLGRTNPGTNRLWPLPWPGRHDRASWLPILVAWLLTIVVTMLALLIAVLLFQNKPPQPPPPPLPTQQQSSGGGSGSPSNNPSQASGTPSSPSPSNGSGSPSSASPSQGSSSASPASPSGSQSASATPSDTPGNDSKPSGDPSMETPDPSGEQSGQGGPTPNKKL